MSDIKPSVDVLFPTSEDDVVAPSLESIGQLLEGGTAEILNELPELLNDLESVDNTGEAGHQVNVDPVATLDKLSAIKQILAQYAAGEHSEIIAKLNTFIEQSEAGYKVRVEKHLPSTYRQVEEIRKMLYRMGSDETMADAGMAIKLLLEQPDAARYVPNLKQEYVLISGLLEEGMNPDFWSVRTNIYKVNAGLVDDDAVECLHRMETLDKLEANLLALKELAELQGITASGANGQYDHYQDLIAVIPEQRQSIIHRAIRSLEFRTDISSVLYAQRKLDLEMAEPDDYVTLAGTKAELVTRGQQEVERALIDSGGIHSVEELLALTEEEITTKIAELEISYPEAVAASKTARERYQSMLDNKLVSTFRNIPQVGKYLETLRNAEESTRQEAVRQDFQLTAYRRYLDLQPEVKAVKTISERAA